MFIEYAAKGRSTREKELIDSRARAHAAKHAWSSKLRGLRRSTGPQRRLDRTGEAESQKSESSTTTPAATPSGSISITADQSPQQALSQISRSEASLTPEENWQFAQALFGAVASPVNSYPVPLDNNKIRSIEYFPKLWSRWAADVIPNHEDREAATQVAVRSIVQRCLTDELHMNAFMSYVLQRAPNVDATKVTLTQNAVKALVELRARIEGGMATLEEVVWPIIFLAHYELFGSQTVWAGRAHLKAIVELGGMEYLDEVTKVYLRRLDRGWWSDYPSIFTKPNSPRPAWEPLISGNVTDNAGTGFLGHADILGTTLARLLPFVIDAVRAGIRCKELWAQGSEDSVMQNKVIRRCQDLMDALREQLPAKSERTACIYPSMIWLQYMTWAMRDLLTKASSAVAAYRNITSHAHPNLLRCVEQSSQCYELLLWAAMVGITTASDTNDRARYARRALILASIADVFDLKACLEKFVWFEECPIIDRELICAACDEAVRSDSTLATSWWLATRAVLLSSPSPAIAMLDPV
jgi:hypothetical protein